MIKSPDFASDTVGLADKERFNKWFTELDGFGMDVVNSRGEMTAEAKMADRSRFQQVSAAVIILASRYVQAFFSYCGDAKTSI
jgi:hypothetical protein